MAWSTIVNNQLVSRANLQDAVTTGVFSLNPSQTIPSTDSNKQVTSIEAETWCAVFARNPSTPSPDNQCPPKSWFISTPTDSATFRIVNIASSTGLPRADIIKVKFSVYKKIVVDLDLTSNPITPGTSRDFPCTVTIQGPWDITTTLINRGSSVTGGTLLLIPGDSNCGQFGVGQVGLDAGQTNQYHSTDQANYPPVIGNPCKWVVSSNKIITLRYTSN